MDISISGTSVISPQGQVTLPAKIRKALDLKPGDVISWLAVKAKEGDSQLVALKQPKNWVEANYGIAKKHYAKYGGGDKYLEKERASWD